MSESDLHSLVIGTLAISGAEVVEVDGYSFATESGIDFGDADAEARVIESALMDGDLESIERTGNKEIQIPVIIRGVDADALARGEAALDLECLSARELRWTPPGANGATSIYDVQWALTRHEFDDLREMGERPERHMALEVRVFPFPRSDTQVVAEAIGSGMDTETVAPVVTQLYVAANATGWSYFSRGATGVKLGPVEYTPGAGVGNAEWSSIWGGMLRFQPAAPFAMSGNRFLAITTAVTRTSGSAVAFGPLNVSWSASLNTNLSPIATIGSTTYYLLPAGVPPIYALTLPWKGIGLVSVSKIVRQDSMPIQSTGRQLVRQFPVKGSARTQGSLHLWHTQMALGGTLVYTWQADGSGYVPTIDQHLNASASAPRVTDTQAALGGFMTINATSAAVYEVPADLIPEGTYNVLPRAKHPSAAEGQVVVHVRCETVLNGAVVGTQTMFEPLQWTNADYRVLSAGAPILPPSRVARGNLAKVRITVTTNGPDLKLDSVYLCNTDIGDLTLLDCGTSLPVPGGASNHAWFDTPTLSDPYPAVWVGTKADRSDARHIDGDKCVLPLGHDLEPGECSVLTVSNAYSLAAEVRHYRRARHNVTQEEVA